MIRGIETEGLSQTVNSTVPSGYCLLYTSSKKPEWVTEAHAGGIEVNAWTVNSTADMMACIALGVDYITTDNPATLKKLLETPFVTAPK